MARKPGRARNDAPKRPAEKDLPGKLREIATALAIGAHVDSGQADFVRLAADKLDGVNALVDKTWQEACDAELERADEEYRSMRDAVIAFDAVVLAGKASWDRTRPPRLQGCSIQDAADFAHRLRVILDAESRLKALDMFETVTGLKIDDPDLARTDAKAVKALHEEPGQAGLVLNNLRLCLEQLDSGRKHILGVVERMEKTLRESRA